MIHRSKRKPTALRPNRGQRKRQKYTASALRPGKPYRATAEEWVVLRQQLHTRANGRCENLSCQVCTPLAVGEAHHVKHRSKLGADTLENLIWWCRRCHNSHHRPKAVQP